MTDNYNFKRLAKPGEKSWDDVVKRFINELIVRGGKTPKEDLEWALLNYYTLPNSPALLTAGSKKFYASACSSYPIQDSMDEGPFSILNTLKIASLATKAGIGTGFNFSNLRSKEETVSGKSGVTGGPVSFLRAYNGFFKEITQAMRKSAAMGLLHVSHPDIIDYINCKGKDGDIANFNLSVLLTDEFMKAVESDGMFFLKYITKEGGKEVRAREIFDLIAQRAWENGEPAVMFEDTIRRDHFEEMKIVLANPCSEALLTAGADWLELCVLGSINLPRYIKLNQNSRKRLLKVLVGLLNDIIDVQDYVTDYHRIGMQERNRKIGVGVAGLATVLAMKGIKYSSNDAFSFSKEIFKEIGEYAVIASEELGNLRGIGRYNGSLLSVAPTSTISNIFDEMNEMGCSYGIEPYFALESTTSNSYGKFEKKEKIVDYLKGEIAHIECANDLSWIDHLRPLESYYSANKKGITQGASKTLNFKNNVTVDDIKEAMMYCWKHGIKAISFYRDGSRKNQVISAKGVKYDNESRPEEIVISQAPKRPEVLPCEIFHLASEGKRLLVLVGLFKDRPFEIFAGLEKKINIPKKYKKGYLFKKENKYNLVVGEGDDQLTIEDVPAMFENLQHGTVSRLTSMSLRHGIPVKYVCEQLAKEGEFDAFQKALSRVLKKYIMDNEQAGVKCPNDGGKMIYISGCLTCTICSRSSCS